MQEKQEEKIHSVNGGVNEFGHIYNLTV